MNIRRGIATLSVAGVLMGVAVFSPAPASAVACGVTKDVTVSAAGHSAAHSHYTTSCKTLTGNIMGWTIKGYIEDLNWNDNYYGRLDAVIAGQGNVAIAVAGQNSPYFFTFTGSGPNATAQVYTCAVNFYNPYDCIP